MEIWKDIMGYEGIYQISNQGRIASVSRVLKDKNGKEKRYKGRVLLPQPNSSGYLRVHLKRDGKLKHHFVHRLVALHFVGNPCDDENTIVNHLDSNYLNNAASNLEWTTYKGNMEHAKARGRLHRTAEWLKNLRESNEKNGRSVIGTNIETGETVYFVCLNDSRTAGFDPTCVCDCCKGKRNRHKGYTWRYA